MSIYIDISWIFISLSFSTKVIIPKNVNICKLLLGTKQGKINTNYRYFGGFGVILGENVRYKLKKEILGSYLLISLHIFGF